jgi:hypothetical protein
MVPSRIKQERCGLHGRKFFLYKFRTMVVDAPKLGGPLTIHDDPRITRFGRILRKSKIDELPQLVNVLRPLITPNNTIAAYPNGNALVITDYADNLKRLDRIIEPAGAVALFYDSAPAIPANAWRKVWNGIREHYEPNTGPHDHDPNWLRNEAILLESPFARLQRFGVIERRPIDVDTLVQRALSMGSTSPAHLGENMPAMVTEIRAALANVREEVVETSALVAWRSNS